MKKIVLIGLIVLCSSSFLRGSDQQPFAQINEFSEFLMKALKDSPHDFTKKLPLIKKKIADESIDVDSMPILYMCRDFTLGSFIDQALAKKLFSVTLEGPDFIANLKILAALSYDYRSQKKGALHPHMLLRQLISTVLQTAVSHCDLKRFIAAGSYDIRNILVTEGGGPETIYEYLKARVPKHGRAELIFTYFNVQFDGAEEFRQNPALLIEYLKKGLSSREAYIDFINYYESGNFDVDTIEYAPGQMVGPLIDRSAKAGEANVNDILAVVKTKRSKDEHAVSDKFKKSEEDLAPKDRFCMLMGKALSADRSTFPAHYRALKEFYAAGEYDVDKIIYAIGANPSSGTLLEYSAGSCLMKYGSLHHAIVSALVYQGRSRKPSNSPNYMLVDFIVGALLGEDEEFTLFKSFYEAGTYDVDQIPMPEQFTQWGASVDALLKAGFTHIDVPSTSLKLLRVVQEGRSDSYSVVRFLCERFAKGYQQTLPLLEAWLKEFPLGEDLVSIDPSRPDLSLKKFLTGLESQQLITFFSQSTLGFTRISSSLVEAPSAPLADQGLGNPSVSPLQSLLPKTSMSSLSVSRQQQAALNSLDRSLTLKGIVATTLLLLVGGLLYKKVFWGGGVKDENRPHLASSRGALIDPV